jgi:hypothetical protein
VVAVFKRCVKPGPQSSYRTQLAIISGLPDTGRTFVPLQSFKIVQTSHKLMLCLTGPVTPSIRPFVTLPSLNRGLVAPVAAERTRKSSKPRFTCAGSMCGYARKKNSGSSLSPQGMRNIHSNGFHLSLSDDKIPERQLDQHLNSRHFDNINTVDCGSWVYPHSTLRNKIDFSFISDEDEQCQMDRDLQSRTPCSVSQACEALDSGVQLEAGGHHDTHRHLVEADDAITLPPLVDEIEAAWNPRIDFIHCERRTLGVRTL